MILRLATRAFHFGRSNAGVLKRFASTQKKTRNIGIIAHIDAGKTTTTERMLYYSGITGRLGDVDHGDTVTDFLPAERERGITIQSAAISFDWQDHTINLIDTPGHADFTFEVVRSLRILDGVVTILDAVAGVEAQTEKVWSQAAQLDIPRIVYVNKMDRPGAGFGRTCREVISRLKTPVAILNIPYFKGEPGIEQFVGVHDVLENKTITWEGDGKEFTVSDAVDGSALVARNALVETLAGLDEDVVNAYLEAGEYDGVSNETLRAAIRRLTLDNKVVPVLCGASFRNIGVQPLLDAILNFLPDPHERVADLPTGLQKATSLLAFKVRHDPVRGILVYVRGYSGKLKKGFSMLNTTTGERERASALLQMQADQPIEISEIDVGQIGVLVGTKNVRTGDTLIAHPTKRDGVSQLKNLKDVNLLPIEIPEAVFVARISPRSVSDQRIMNQALEDLLREDPSLRLTFDAEASQWLLAGMGELHLEIARDRLIQDLKANVEVGDVMITYKEQLVKSIAGTSSEVSESNAALRADAKVTIEPIFGSPEGTKLPDHNYYAVSMRKHPQVSFAEIKQQVAIGITPVLASGGKISRGALYGHQFKVELSLSPECFDASLVASAVRKAASAAIESLDSRGFNLLEPVMSLSVSVPESEVGSVMNDISVARRGQIIGLADQSDQVDEEFVKLAEQTYTPPDHTMYLSKHGEQAARPSTLLAVAPLRMLVGYLNVLRSTTQGRGTFQMSFKEFQPVETRDIEDALRF